MTDRRKHSTEQQGNAMNGTTAAQQPTHEGGYSADAQSVELSRYRDLLTQKELSERIDTKESTLAQWRYLGRGPKFVRLGRKIFYREQDIADFIEANVHQSTSS